MTDFDWDTPAAMAEPATAEQPLTLRQQAAADWADVEGEPDLRFLGDMEPKVDALVEEVRDLVALGATVTQHQDTDGVTKWIAVGGVPGRQVRIVARSVWALAIPGWPERARLEEQARMRQAEQQAGRAG